MDEFGMNFIPPCFQHKNGWYPECVFSYSKRMKFYHITAWNTRHVFGLFAGYEFLTKDGWILRCVFDTVYGVWISDKEWMNFEVCFWSVYRVWISDKEWINFNVCFWSVYRGMNILWKMEDLWYMYLCYWSTSITYGPLALIKNLANYILNLIKINNYITVSNKTVWVLVTFTKIVLLC